MTVTWVPAYGEHQLPFLGAANRALRGDLAACPKCAKGLRAYFHVFDQETGKGSLWVWCAHCGMHATLPRVKPPRTFPDPFAAVPRGEFGAMEINANVRFLDRLEQLWIDGTLHAPR
jgi:hypothetical protein